MKQYTLEATPVASAQELKDQKTPKAKRIVVGTDTHLRSYQATRKVDNAAIGAVVNFRSETELLLYVEKQCKQAEEVVVVYEAGPLGYGLYRSGSIGHSAHHHRDGLADSAVPAAIPAGAKMAGSL